MNNLSNFVALDDFGGLQTLYTAWIVAHVRQCGIAPLTINRARRPPLADFKQVISLVGGEVLSPNLDRFKKRVPSNFIEKFYDGLTNNSRGKRLYRSLNRIGMTRLILWNSLPEEALIRASTQTIVYDHGLSWIKKASPKNKKWMRKANGYIAVSKAAEIMLRQRWDIVDPITIVRNPLRFDTQAPLDRVTSVSNSGPLALGVAGRLVSFKGFASVINALRVLKQRGIDATLAIAGTGPERGRLSQLAQSLQLEDAVFFENTVRDMPSFYGKLDIFICPSLREPFGLVSLEANYYGVPTILANVDGLPETVVDEGAAILIDPTMSIADYVATGGSADNMPEMVFHPDTGNVDAPLALDPQKIADAIEVIIDNKDAFRKRAIVSSKIIRAERSIDSYARNLFASLKLFD